MLVCGCEEDLPPPECGDGEVAIEGEIDGMAVMARTDQTYGHGFANGSSGGMELSMVNAEERVEIFIDSLIANGGTGDARGVVSLFSGPELISYGTCSDDGFSGSLTIDADMGPKKYRLSSVTYEKTATVISPLSRGPCAGATSLVCRHRSSDKTVQLHYFWARP